MWVLVFWNRADFLDSEREQGYVTAKACVRLMMFILNPTGISVLGLYLIDR